jgi:hypothetical protein
MVHTDRIEKLINCVCQESRCSEVPDESRTDGRREPVGRDERRSDDGAYVVDCRGRVPPPPASVDAF